MQKAIFKESDAALPRETGCCAEASSHGSSHCLLKLLQSSHHLLECAVVIGKFLATAAHSCFELGIIRLPLVVIDLDMFCQSLHGVRFIQHSESRGAIYKDQRLRDHLSRLLNSHTGDAI